eukprot:3891955-Heterocapsa_arctica.AAC.1
MIDSKYKKATKVPKVKPVPRAKAEPKPKPPKKNNPYWYTKNSEALSKDGIGIILQFDKDGRVVKDKFNQFLEEYDAFCI